MNTKLSRINIWAAVIAVIFSLGACDDEPALSDNLVTFETEALGFEGSETEVKIGLTRDVTADTEVQIAMTSGQLIYGMDFTTEPDGSSGTITLIIPQRSQEAAFRVIRSPGIFLNGDERITFTITSATEPVLPGAAERVTAELSFAAITSDGSQLQLSGKTDASPYANSVYADLSANKQIPVDRKSWNLGFYNGEEFRVILNPGYQTTAVALGKTDISTVTLADADAVMNLNHDPSDPATLPLADYWDGDLTKTTFSEVAAGESDNKVYLVSFEGSKNKDQWFKVKVTRNAQGYKIQYARIGETTIKTLDVPKNTTYNFNFVSLESNAIVVAEPPKANWDIEWSYSTNNSGLNTPYWFQDFVLLNNVGGAGAVEIVKTSVADAETAYTTFAEADLAGITFISKRDVIGSKWRATGGPGGGATGIKRDRFYVIKDPRGNIYKLKFVSMGLGSDGGERGKPVIEYKLVKKAG
jgi:hypothetical protein